MYETDIFSSLVSVDSNISQMTAYLIILETTVGDAIDGVLISSEFQLTFIPLKMLKSISPSTNLSINAVEMRHKLHCTSKLFVLQSRSAIFAIFS